MGRGRVTPRRTLGRVLGYGVYTDLVKGGPCSSGISFVRFRTVTLWVRGALLRCPARPTGPSRDGTRPATSHPGVMDALSPGPGDAKVSVGDTVSGPGRPTTGEPSVAGGTTCARGRGRVSVPETSSRDGTSFGVGPLPSVRVPCPGYDRRSLVIDMTVSVVFGCPVD